MPDVCAQKIYGAKWHVKMCLNQYIVDMFVCYFIVVSKILL